ncbi:MAG: hypothetical protein B6244_03045 [Candidatus Cloacimonetes bacterium 4572_55]|nr:MAG: hypothetical protein B6244_03045 [Candidatus Cloacimonetes bacterium 4572_55]
MSEKKMIVAWTGDANMFPAISVKTTRRNMTGSWRYMRPFYRSLTPPCNRDCPAGNDIRGFIKSALDGKYDDALEIIFETSPFPSVCGRVCYHPCETQCNRGFYDESISIHSIERYIGEQDFDIKKFLPEKNIRMTKKRVAIIGSGPAGLSCAYHLAKNGIDSTVFESMPKAGGMLYYGIPSYRLPKDILEKEIDRIRELGVKIQTNTRVNSEMFDELREEYDALFVGIGAHLEQKMSIQGEDLKGVSSGLKFLKEINAGKNVEISGTLIVVGGGNTAMDVARSAKRMGVKSLVVYRRSEAEMPAHPDEVKEARDEGIEFHFLSAPIRYMGQKERVTSVEIQRMELGDPDESGRRRPVPIPGDTYIMDADFVMTAIGERPELDPVANHLKLQWNRVYRDQEGQTSMEGVFCGGDAGVNPGGTVVDAIGEGRRAAFSIQAYLTGEPSKFVDYPPKSADFETLNQDYFTPSPRMKPPELPVSKRNDFREVVAPVDEDTMKKEAQRCFYCGDCNLCLTCFKFCPDAAIKQMEDGRLEIDLDYCKGCGICVTECPRNAMELEEERNA